MTAEEQRTRGARTVLVTVTYNGVEDWDEFLAGVRAQDDPDWELVVVDNDSRDGTVERLRAVEDDPRVHVVLNGSNRGVAAANNQGIRRALAGGASEVVLINNDTALPADLLSTLRAARERTGADAVSPLIAFHEDTTHIWYGGGRWKRRRGVANVHNHWKGPLGVVGSAAFETDYAPTTCLMISRALLERVGLMDERYFVYWDDADFLWRARAAGARVVVEPATVLLHKASSSTGGMQSDFSIRYMHRNQVLFARKFHGAFWTAYTCVALLVDGVVRVLKGRDRPRQAVLRARAVAEGLRLGARSPGPTADGGLSCAS